jgi:hypothetical protein
LKIDDDETKFGIGEDENEILNHLLDENKTRVDPLKYISKDKIRQYKLKLLNEIKYNLDTFEKV